MGISIGDIEAGRDVNITQTTVPQLAQHIKEAKDEDKPALVKRLLEIAPDIAVKLIEIGLKAAPHLVK